MVAGSRDAKTKFPIWKMRCLADVPTIERLANVTEMLVPGKKDKLITEGGQGASE